MTLPTGVRSVLNYWHGILEYRLEMERRERSRASNGLTALNSFALICAVTAVFACHGRFNERDSCDGVDCSGHGLCRLSDGLAECLCESGYEPVELRCVSIDADADADQDSSLPSDADVDEDTDSAGPGEVIALEVLPPNGSYSAGSSVVLELEPSWDGPPTSDVNVTLSVNGIGLLSHSGAPGTHSTLVLSTELDGSLPRVRLTFPLALDEYQVRLEWSRDGEAFAPVGGVFTLSEPSLVEHPIGGSVVVAPDGFEIETYVSDLSCTDETFDDRWNHPTAIEILHDGHESLIAVSCLFETFLIAPDDSTRRLVTRPATADGAGPDQITELIYSGPTGSEGVLYALGGGLDRGGGLFTLDTTGVEAPTRLAQSNACAGLELVNHHEIIPPGVYWGALGYVHRYNFVDFLDEEFWSSQAHWPQSIAIGSAQIYGDYPFILTRCANPDCSEISLRWNNESGISGDVVPLGTNRVSLRSGRGGVFGQLVYAIEDDAISLVEHAPVTVPFAPLIEWYGSRTITSIAFQPSSPLPNIHPPGLYVLLRQDSDFRIFRLFQDLEN